MFSDRFAAPVRLASGARELVLRTILSGAVLAVVTAGLPGPAEAKGPGRTYCFYKTCHRVKTIEETQALVGRDMTVVASHYDSCEKDRFNPCGLTSSGEPFFPERADNAASPVLPDGTIVLVWSKTSREAVVLRINNAGPYWGNRKLDLSRAAARKLGIAGVGEVTLRVLQAPTPEEARYSRNRRYDPVPGPIGQFASLDGAHAAMSIMVAQGLPQTLALAGLARPGAADPSADPASQFAAPVVAGFAIPKGALADALIAQSRIEPRVVKAAEPAAEVVASEQVSVNVTAVAAKPAAARVVAPRRTSIRAVEVKPAAADPLTALAMAVTDIFDPPKAAKRVRTAKAARKSLRVAAAGRATAKSAKARVRTQVAAAVKSEEFRAGHTTYAEDRYRTFAATPAARTGTKVRTAKGAAGWGPNPPTAANGPAPTKQANAARGRKSAALRKAAGWQSSHLVDRPASRPRLTGPQPRIPIDAWREDGGKTREPLRRVHPSALV